MSSTPTASPLAPDPLPSQNSLGSMAQPQPSPAEQHLPTPHDMSSNPISSPPAPEASSPQLPDSLPSPNSLGNASQPTPDALPISQPQPSPAEPTLDNGFRFWISQPVVASFFGGGIAGAVSRTVVSPLERLKILLQVQSVGREEYKMSVGKALGKMWREEGWRGMMAGNGANCIRIVPYSAVQFGSYNLYKKAFESAPGAQLDAISRLVCGAMAGVTSVTATYPLDIVRTRLSIQSASFASLAKEKGSSAAEAAEVARRKLPGMWGTMKQMYASEGGITALYRGIVPTVAGVAPYVGLNFMIYESVRTYFTREGEKDPSAAAKLGAGAIAGAVAQTCTYPLDVLRRRFQINTMSGMGYQYKGIFDAIRVITAQEGIRGLYKGITPNLLKVAPSMAASWLSFEMSRDYFISLRPEDEM